MDPRVLIELAVYAVVALVVGYSIRRIVTSPSSYHRQHDYVMLLEATYPVGVLMKFTEVGPEFIRYHLSDIGFPAFASRILFFLLMLGYGTVYAHGHAKPRSLHTVEAMAVTAGPRQASIVLAMLVSCAYEVFIGRLYSSSGQEVKWVGDFDWIDIAAYGIGGTMLFVLCYKIGKTAAQLLEQDRAELRVEQLAQQLRREQAKAKRKSTKTGRTRPGGRR